MQSELLLKATRLKWNTHLLSISRRIAHGQHAVPNRTRRQMMKHDVVRYGQDTRVVGECRRWPRTGVSQARFHPWRTRLVRIWRIELWNGYRRRATRPTTSLLPVPFALLLPIPIPVSSLAILVLILPRASPLAFAAWLRRPGVEDELVEMAW